jgi:Glycosyl transferase family 2
MHTTRGHVSRGKTLPEFVNLRTALPAPRTARRVGKAEVPHAAPTPRALPLPVVKDEPPPEAYIESEVYGLNRLLCGQAVRERTFCVIVPTWNRGTSHELGRALESIFRQQYDRWIALVLDDGSSDATSRLVREYMKTDPRLHYVAYPRRRGGVAVNERGMWLAIQFASWWSRLGSDDAWGPKKLAYDAVALEVHAACYGSYRVQRGTELLPASFNRSSLPWKVRDTLLGGTFAVSWANVACRTSLLESVRRRHGSFANPALVNMEDFLVNVRIARVAGWVWRGKVGGELVVNPLEEGLVSEEFEASWNDSLTGASGNERQRNEDERLTVELIRKGFS